VTSRLLIDISPYQARTVPPSCWPRLAAAGAPWGPVILKAGEGARDTGPWLREHAAAIRAAGLDLGLYWYLRLDRSPTEQADRLAAAIAETGPTLRAIVDIEEGSGNDDVVARHGTGAVSMAGLDFTARITQRTGLAPILYAGGWLRSLKLRDRMGCAALWLAAYVAKLPAQEWCAQLGFGADELWAWQYAGLGRDGVDAKLDGYPRTTPIGDADISAVVMPDGVARMRWCERPSPRT
jgi:GH25 family lysozyme M1 (1,4-beta-N-acetylmuramidase)